MSDRKEGMSVGRIIAIVLGALVVLFAALNSQSVKVHWLIGTTSTPLFIVILLFTAIGLAIGFFLGRRERRG